MRGDEPETWPPGSLIEYEVPVGYDNVSHQPLLEKLQGFLVANTRKELAILWHGGRLGTVSIEDAFLHNFQRVD